MKAGAGVRSGSSRVCCNDIASVRTLPRFDTVCLRECVQSEIINETDFPSPEFPVTFSPMRILCLTLAAALLLPGLTARADLTLVQEVVSDGTPTRMTMKIKGSKVRVDASPMASSIIDTESGDMTNLIHPQKMVMRVSGAQLKDMAQAMKPTAATDARPMAEPKPTGRKETILGYTALEHVMETPEGRMALWLTTDYPDWKGVVAELARMSEGAWAKQLAGGAQPEYDVKKLPGLPLRTEMDLRSGMKAVVRFESIDRKEIPESEFAIPSDYKAIPMPAMGIPATAEP